MAEKKSTKGDSEDYTQAFLRVLLRRVGGTSMDVSEAELEAANEEGISGEVEVVRVPMIEDAERSEDEDTPYIYRLKSKGE